MRECPTCATRSAEVVYQLRCHAVVRCQRCRVLYNSYFPSKDQSAKVFSEDYHFGVQKAAFEIQRKDYQNDPSIPLFEHGLNILEQRLGRRGRVLDVGCGLGTFMKVADNRGWKPCGVEISQHAAEHTATKYGFEVFNGEIEEATFADSSFDVVTFWDVIEHVSLPRDNLLRAYQLLTPDGLLLITTDNFDCLISDVGRVLYGLSFGRFKYGLERLYIPYNCTYFTEHTFRTLIGQCGFLELYFEKMEYPIAKIRTNAVERIILKCMYALSKLLRKETQFILVAKKNAEM